MNPRLFLCLLTVSPALADWRVDLDGDGTPETITLDADHITVRGGKMAGAHPRPEGVPADAGDALQFVDLNADGFSDVLFADEKSVAIHLWTTSVRKDLGWAAGWSQNVRVGPRDARPPVLPPLAGASVRVHEGNLVIREKNGNEAALSARELIAVPMPPVLAPAEAVASIKVPDGFTVELVAHEPQVIDPVAFDWDAAGRLWVVEMRDYPSGLDGQGQPGGVVKVLTDADGDGRFEKTDVFVEGLPFPTGVMPWRRGALIAAAPDVIYAEDRDGDGRADVREVLFTGFKPGNQQHRFNGFEWGLDGWVYAANGDSGGRVKSLATGKEISISGRDVRFRPDTGELETVSGMTQYGLRRDDWGNWFGNDNPVWLWHVTLPERYLARNPALAVKRVKNQLANYPDPTRVFPLSPALERPNQPWSLNHVTSACSPTPYRDALFGESFAGSVFIGEPVHNAVHREVLEREGSGFRSHRAAGEETREFLASTDNWFRPVFLRTGPDGALWVADMHRFVLEHPEWISPEMQARLDLRAGSDRGRIFRVAPPGARRKVPNLAPLEWSALVAAMDSPNGWQRDMVQRLLLEKRATALAPQLRELLGPSRAPHVRLQALATLGGLQALTPDDVRTALADRDSWVRCEALRQAETMAGDALFPAVAALAEDSDAAVRLQVAFTLGFWPAERAEPVLAALAAGADDDLRVAIMSSLRPESVLFQRLRKNDAIPAAAALPAVKPTSADREKVIAGYASLANLKGDPTKGRAHFDTLCAVCHRLRGQGHEVGPDLDMTGAKPDAWLLAAILDPAQSIEARYRPWKVTLKAGGEMTGVISAETANNLVLRLPGGAEQAILRADVAAVSPVEGSLMPAGFESALPPAAMADLLAWLRAGK